MSGKDIIAVASIIQQPLGARQPLETKQPFKDIPTSILEILPTEFINILITKVNPAMTKKLEAILRIRSQRSLQLQNKQK